MNIHPLIKQPISTHMVWVLGFPLSRYLYSPEIIWFPWTISVKENLEIWEDVYIPICPLTFGVTQSVWVNNSVRRHKQCDTKTFRSLTTIGLKSTRNLFFQRHNALTCTLYYNHVIFSYLGFYLTSTNIFARIIIWWWPKRCALLVDGESTTLLLCFKIRGCATRETLIPLVVPENGAIAAGHTYLHWIQVLRRMNLVHFQYPPWSNWWILMIKTIDLTS